MARVPLFPNNAELISLPNFQTEANLFPTYTANETDSYFSCGDTRTGVGSRIEGGEGGGGRTSSRIGDHVTTTTSSTSSGASAAAPASAPSPASSAVTPGVISAATPCTVQHPSRQVHTYARATAADVAIPMSMRPQLPDPDKQLSSFWSAEQEKVSEHGDSCFLQALRVLEQCRPEPKTPLLTAAVIDVDSFPHHHREFNHVGPLKSLETPPVVASTEILVSVAIAHQSRELKMQEYTLLGSQTLLHLRHCISCSSDFPTQQQQQQQQQQDQQVRSFRQTLSSPIPFSSEWQKASVMERTGRSAFFFIENVFYNDPNSTVDYTQNILTWMRDVGQPEPPVKSMETPINSLSIRLYTPYLYCHRGKCEHIIYFTDVRMLHATDSHKVPDYPILIFKGRERRRKCALCRIHHARFIITEDKEMPESPMYLCHYCYGPLHLDWNKDPLHPHKVEEYRGEW